MADQLNKLGFIPWLSKSIATVWWLKLAYSPGHFNIVLLLFTLLICKFYSTYQCDVCSITRRCHRGPYTPLFSALMLGFFGNLLASTTHYSSGPAPILFSSGYVTQKRWWTINLIFSFSLLSILDWFRITLDESKLVYFKIFKLALESH